MEVLTGVISALVTVILVLVAFLRFYLPRHDQIMHNPREEAIMSILSEISNQIKGQKAMIDGRQGIMEEWHHQVMEALIRIEGKLK